MIFWIFSHDYITSWSVIYESLRYRLVLGPDSWYNSHLPRDSNPQLHKCFATFVSNQILLYLVHHCYFFISYYCVFLLVLSQFFPTQQRPFWLIVWVAGVQEVRTSFAGRVLPEEPHVPRPLNQEARPKEEQASWCLRLVPVLRFSFTNARGMDIWDLVHNLVL